MIHFSFGLLFVTNATFHCLSCTHFQEQNFHIAQELQTYTDAGEGNRKLEGQQKQEVGVY